MNGKKTYLAALAGVLGAAAGYYTGTLDMPAAIQLAFSAVAAATIRHGVSTEAAK